MIDYWVHDPEKCEICQGKGNIGKPGVLDHLMLVMQQSGEIEAVFENGEMKYHLTEKGRDKVENEILPRLEKERRELETKRE